MGYRNSIVRYRNSIVGYRNSIVGNRNSIVGYRNSVVGYRNNIAGYRSSILGKPSEKTFTVYAAKTSNQYGSTIKNVEHIELNLSPTLQIGTARMKEDTGTEEMSNQK